MCDPGEEGGDSFHLLPPVSPFCTTLSAVGRICVLEFHSQLCYVARGPEVVSLADTT